MDDFVAIATVGLFVVFVAVLSVWVAAAMLIYGFMHVSAWVYRRLGGKDWRDDERKAENSNPNA